LQQAEPSFQLCNDNEISLCGMSVAARRDGGGWNQIMAQWDARGNTLEMELLMAQLSINRGFSIAIGLITRGRGCLNVGGMPQSLETTQEVGKFPRSFIA